jgi:hypothetical protein
MQTTRGDENPTRRSGHLPFHRESAICRMPWEDCKPAYLASGLRALQLPASVAAHAPAARSATLTVALPAITGSVYDERPPLLVDL